MPFVTLAAQTPSPLTYDLLIVLGVAAAIAIVLQRLRLAIVPAYLIAGAIVGPGALGLVHSPDNLDAIGRLAILLLMFGVGLELRLSTLRNGAAWLFAAGVLSSVMTALMGWPVAMLFGLHGPGAMLVSMALSLSSTAVVLRILAQRREMHHMTGRLAFAVLIMQDLIVVGFLAAIPALAHWAHAGVAVAQTPAPDAPRGPGEMFGVGVARVASVAGLVILGRITLPRLLLEAAKSGSAELMTVLAVAAALAAGVATQALGFSPALGAFLAGFVLSETPFRHQLSGQIGPARDLFVAVFFTSLGMFLDVQVVTEHWWAILLAGIAMSAVKSLVIGGSCWALGATPATAIMVGVALSQAGEFSLVVLQAAQPFNIVAADIISGAIGVVVLSLILTPMLMRLGRLLAPIASHAPVAPWTKRSPLSRTGDNATNSSDLETPVRMQTVIGGFGPIGRAVALRLDEANVAYTIVELNPHTVRAEDRAGHNVVYGDIGSDEVLRSAGIERADALIVTIPDMDAAIRACQTARKLSPDLFILCRAPLLARHAQAKGQGADVVVIDELAAAQAMQREIVRALADRRRRAQRAGEQKSLFGPIDDTDSGTSVSPV